MSSLLPDSAEGMDSAEGVDDAEGWMVQAARPSIHAVKDSLLQVIPADDKQW